MSYTSVQKITATGTSGAVKGVVFMATPDKQGRYVLNKKTSSTAKNRTNKAVNKVYAENLTEAANLLATNDFLINMTARVNSKIRRALREFKKVVIHGVVE